jgi:hypothetical protein
MLKFGLETALGTAGIAASFFGSSFSGTRVLQPIKKIIERTTAAIIKAAAIRKLTFFTIEVLKVLSNALQQKPVTPLLKIDLINLRFQN